MDIKKNPLLFIVILFIVLGVASIFFWQDIFNQPQTLNTNIPLPPEEENIINLEGKIYSTPEGSQFDDYFVSSDGQEYGIEAEIGNSDIKDMINAFRDSESMISIKGELVNDVPDYGGRQILISEISEKENESVGLANPAAVYCQDQGGTLDSRETDKGTITYCIFDEGECEEWAYFRGECLANEGNIILSICDDFADADACIEVYEPVCARVMDEMSQPEWKTYSSACHACIAEGAIFGYKEGECE